MELTLVHGIEKLEHIIKAHQAIFDQLRTTGAHIKVTMMVGNHDYDLACDAGFADKLQAYNINEGFLKKIELNKNAAVARQRIGALPPGELEKALAAAHEDGDFLLRHARPYWYHASRKRRHQTIAAKANRELSNFGPFPLIYADPPWKFKVGSAKDTIDVASS
jgi:hypothetical protein